MSTDEGRRVNINFEMERFSELAEVSRLLGLSVAGLVRMWVYEKLDDRKKSVGE